MWPLTWYREYKRKKEEKEEEDYRKWKGEREARTFYLLEFTNINTNEKFTAMIPLKRFDLEFDPDIRLNSIQLYMSETPMEEKNYFKYFKGHWSDDK